MQSTSAATSRVSRPPRPERRSGAGSQGLCSLAPGSAPFGRNELEAALLVAPDREAALAGAFAVAELLGRNDQAQDYAERLVALNPWDWEYHSRLARQLIKRRDWNKAATECSTAIRLNPFASQIRMLEIQCLLAL